MQEGESKRSRAVIPVKYIIIPKMGGFSEREQNTTEYVLFL